MGFTGTTLDIVGRVPNEINRLRELGPFGGPSGSQFGSAPDLLKRQAKGAIDRAGQVFEILPFKPFKDLRCIAFKLLIR